MAWVRAGLVGAVLALAGACVGIVPIPVQTGTATVPANDDGGDDGY
jgi:hypothetical protein